MSDSSANSAGLRVHNRHPRHLGRGGGNASRRCGYMTIVSAPWVSDWSRSSLAAPYCFQCAWWNAYTKRLLHVTPLATRPRCCEVATEHPVFCSHHQIDNRFTSCLSNAEAPLLACPNCFAACSSTAEVPSSYTPIRCTHNRRTVFLPLRLGLPSYILRHEHGRKYSPISGWYAVKDGESGAHRGKVG